MQLFFAPATNDFNDRLLTITTNRLTINLHQWGRNSIVSSEDLERTGSTIPTWVIDFRTHNKRGEMEEPSMNSGHTSCSGTDETELAEGLVSEK